MNAKLAGTACNGRPKSEATRARLFMPFSRVAGERPREGLGLGLYIASQIAKSHRGKLALSTGAEGTTFTFSMPA